MSYVTNAMNIINFSVFEKFWKIIDLDQIQEPNRCITYCWNFLDHFAWFLRSLVELSNISSSIGFCIPAIGSSNRQEQ